MKYIEQLLRKKDNKNSWHYLPFSLFFFGIMFLNALLIKYSEVSTNDAIKMSIEKYGKNINFLINILPMAVLLVFLLGWVRIFHQQSILSLTTARSQVDWKRVLHGFCIWSVITLVFIGIAIISSPKDYELTFNASAFFPFLFIALLLIPLQTSFEEFLMRGYLMQGIGLATKSRAVALCTTSIIFGLMHLANPEVEQLGYGIMIFYIGMGFFFGIMTLMDDGIELALGFHAANNIIGALLLTSNWTAFQTNSIFLDVSEQPTISYLETFIQIGIVLPLVLFYLGKKYKWNNWTGRLFGRIK
ncbi:MULTISPECIES: CPBP family intramembrane glutamic endopeptidase [Myroides]|uniref:CPBP family intramembrane metalloprotease n=1 Tax=Myroides albus TaxID=2562892 RepID=A0A6I3LI79_9FLAO|nr:MULTISPECIES: CPBP family intramembrane glutamic endopeptidase [Myroides]MTG97963.1 CPBP family intramembrane metalloprotease [Myroides albus]MVX36725.1 CPBP family intramembrane metalloprotease [Myroides sp. LoEW2-1]UVD80253.1 CPBP family intramembrane metalloprotease [Myroides albus]